MRKVVILEEDPPSQATWAEEATLPLFVCVGLHDGEISQCALFDEYERAKYWAVAFSGIDGKIDDRTTPLHKRLDDLVVSLMQYGEPVRDQKLLDIAAKVTTIAAAIRSGLTTADSRFIEEIVDEYSTLPEIMSGLYEYSHEAKFVRLALKKLDPDSIYMV